MRNEFLENFAVDFVTKNWDNITYSDDEWATLEGAIADIRANDETISWVITELAYGYMKKTVNFRISHDNEDDYNIYEIEGRYFKFDEDNLYLKEIKKKTILVEKIIYE